MHFNKVLLGLIAAASNVLAAPALNTRAQEVSAMADVPQWTVKSFTRTCNDADTSCTVSFGIDTHTAPVTNCQYTVTGAPASRTSTNGITCGPYTISSAWSGQFGDGNGFTTWSVTDWSQKLIIWPAYTDRELVNGQPVSPDKSYAPQTLG
ncbi:hypothetical protein VTK56DRAFT_6673 [Thermocarpiscus australiensis]